MKTALNFKSRFRILSKGRISLMVSALLSGSIAYALPQDGKVVDGSATISTNANQMNINQSTHRAIIDWKSFNISANNKVQVNQPSSSAFLLNRVVGNEPSKIFGQLTANGNIMLINQNGILFGKGSRIDVASLIASTANIKNEDFMAGRYKFMSPSNPNAQIINEGTITAKEGGFVSLISPMVVNNGYIIAKNGKVAIAGSDTATIDLYGDDLIVFEIPSHLENKIENNGVIEANYVALSVSDAKEVVDSAINMNGIIKVDSIDTSKGKVLLTGGNINLSGSIDASSENSTGGEVIAIADMESGRLNFKGSINVSSKNSNGGFTETSGHYVKIDDDAKVDASGQTFGEWLIDPNDYTVSATNGDITGTTLSNLLNSSSITIRTDTHGHSGNGDIFVYDDITWNANTKLTLNAQRDIYIGSDILASGDTAGLSLYYGSDYTVYQGNKVTFTGSNPSIYIAGTKYNIIKTIDELENITNTGRYKPYVIVQDIDASSKANFIPIASESGQWFSGVLEGFGNTVSNLTISNQTTNTTGLIGLLKGQVKNLTIDNATIEGRSNVGTIAGYMQTDSLIHNSHVKGAVNVTGNEFVGGLVGYNSEGRIINSGVGGTSTGTTTHITANNEYSYVGGLVGTDYNGFISNTFLVPNLQIGNVYPKQHHPNN